MDESRHFRKNDVNSIWGFTLLEMAVSLTVIGTLSVMGMHLLKTAEDSSALLDTKTQLKTAKKHLQIYTLKNNRLPCPDTDGDGLEEKVCSAQTGWLPYTTIGISNMSNNQVDELSKIRYGVFRNGVPLDLVEYPISENIDDLNNLSVRFNQKLRDITLTPNPNNEHPYVSLNQNGVEGCDEKVKINPAFIISLQVDMKTNRPRANDNCFFSDQISYPTEIIAVTSAELLGWRRGKK
jgi:prepilin-type N-terminal cleavage/methylation domain-containing protein